MIAYFGLCFHPRVILSEVLLSLWELSNYVTAMYSYVFYSTVYNFAQWWANPNHDLIYVMIESQVMIWFECKKYYLETFD